MYTLVRLEPMNFAKYRFYSQSLSWWKAGYLSLLSISITIVLFYIFYYISLFYILFIYIWLILKKFSTIIFYRIYILLVYNSNFNYIIWSNCCRAYKGWKWLNIFQFLQLSQYLGKKWFLTLWCSKLCHFVKIRIFFFIFNKTT